MFQVGDYIIYGSNGVCRVEAIGPMSMGGEEKDYYTLQPVYSKKSKLYTPVNNQKVVMRKVMTKEEMAGLLEEIASIDVLWVPDEKRREEIYKETMRTCDTKDLVRIIKTLYMRKMDRQSQGKRATSSDERYLHMAEESLYGEIAFSMQMPKDSVEEYILEKLEKTAQN